VVCVCVSGLVVLQQPLAESHPPAQRHPRRALAAVLTTPPPTTAATVTGRLPSALAMVAASHLRAHFQAFQVHSTRGQSRVFLAHKAEGSGCAQLLPANACAAAQSRRQRWGGASGSKGGCPAPHTAPPQGAGGPARGAAAMRLPRLCSTDDARCHWNRLPPHTTCSLRCGGIRCVLVR
jgi:hypothetical protein